MLRLRKESEEDLRKEIAELQLSDSGKLEFQEGILAWADVHRVDAPALADLGGDRVGEVAAPGSEVGHEVALLEGEGGDHRKQLGLPGQGPVGIITDLCIMEPEAGSNEFVVTSLHPGVTREQVTENTGWAIRFADQLGETEAPTETELAALRALEARTAAAHGQAGGDE